MRTVRGLFIHGRVPVIVVEDYSVGSYKINTKASRSSRKQEGKYIIIPLELVDHVAPILDRS